MSTSTGRRWRSRVAAGLISSILALALATGAEASGGGGHGGGEKGAPSGGPAFVKVPPIVLPIFDGPNVAGQASLVLALELAKGAKEEDVQIQQRRLVDAFIETLSLVYEERARSGRVIDAATIKPRLLASAERVLGPGVVREVLIQQAFERGARPR